MRIDKEKVKDKPSDKAVYFGEFSKSEIAGLFPASDLLHNIHTDHVYTSNEYAANRNTEEADDAYEYNHQDDILSLNADSIQEVFQRMINMTSLNTISGQTKEESTATETSSETGSSKSKTPVIRKVKFVEDLPGSSDSQLPSTSGSTVGRARKRKGNKKRSSPKRTVKTDCDAENENKKEIGAKNCSNKQTSNVTKEEEKLTICKSVSEDEWKAANRCAEIEREMNALAQFTAELLVRRWGEYLAMTAEKISAFEIENAKQHEMVEEIIDMLEDKGRYVWQLIEELQFF